MASIKDREELFDFFADDLFRYLLPRRINVENCSPPLGKTDDPPFKFCPLYGMSVLCESWRYQGFFMVYFTQNFSSIIKDIESHARFCATFALDLYTKSGGRVFKAFTVIASMILELGVFCHHQRHPHFKYYGGILFSCIFNHILAEEFFSKGGWDSLARSGCCRDAVWYSQSNMEVRTVGGRLEISNEWLREQDWFFILTDAGKLPYGGDEFVIDFDDVTYPWDHDSPDVVLETSGEKSDVTSSSEEDSDVVEKKKKL